MPSLIPSERGEKGPFKVRDRKGDEQLGFYVTSRVRQVTNAFTNWTHHRSTWRARRSWRKASVPTNSAFHQISPDKLSTFFCDYFASTFATIAIFQSTSSFFQSDCMKSCRNFANTQAMLYTSSVLVMIYIHTLSLHRQNRHMRRKRHMKKSISVTSYIYSAWLSQSWLGKIASFMRSIRPAHEATCVPCVRPVRGHPPPDAHGSRGRPPGSG